MFTALALSLAIGAPVPPPAAPLPAGAVPRVMELKANADGKITVSVIRTETRKVQVAVAAAQGGGALPGPATREITVSTHVAVELSDVKDLTVTTADGKMLDKEEAMKKLVAGTIVVVSGDGKPVSPVFLKVFKDETLVLISPELIVPQGPASLNRPAMLPAPGQAFPPAAIPLQPGVQIQVVPPVPVPAPVQPVPVAPPMPPPVKPAVEAPVPSVPVTKPPA
jgi:hypothetical protein